MVLIIGSKEEHAVQDVCLWLDGMGEQSIVLGHEQLETNVLSIALSDEQEELLISGKENDIHTGRLSAVWFRKSSTNQVPLLAELEDRKELHQRLTFHLKRELQGFKTSFYEYLLNGKKCLGHPDKNDINKLYALIQAKKAGLFIPSTLLATQKSLAAEYILRAPAAITKPIQDSVLVWDNNKAYSLYTSRTSAEELACYDEKIFPSLFQAEIHKEYEIRTFYLDGRCYSIAIFSQADKQTTVDFRDYNWSKMNRMCNYKLPAVIELQLDLFMKSIGLASGSIDLIKTPDGRFIFLEVNPVGQFGFVSTHGNYYLEEKVAAYLTKQP